MMLEGNVIRPGRRNSLADLAITPTPLAEGLSFLADLIPEQIPEEGVGRFENKLFTIEIAAPDLDPNTLMLLFKNRIAEIMPIDFCAEPDAPRRIEYGRTLSAHLPGRGHIQVRVDECDERRVTFVTVEGHPLAGAVVFQAERRSSGISFSVETFTRAASMLD